MFWEEINHCVETPVLEPSFNSGGLAEAEETLSCSGISHCEELAGGLSSTFSLSQFSIRKEGREYSLNWTNKTSETIVHSRFTKRVGLVVSIAQLKTENSATPTLNPDQSLFEWETAKRGAVNPQRRSLRTDRPTPSTTTAPDKKRVETLDHRLDLHLSEELSIKAYQVFVYSDVWYVSRLDSWLVNETFCTVF